MSVIIVEISKQNIERYLKLRMERKQYFCLKCKRVVSFREWLNVYCDDCKKGGKTKMNNPKLTEKYMREILSVLKIMGYKFHEVQINNFIAEYKERGYIEQSAKEEALKYYKDNIDKYTTFHTNEIKKLMDLVLKIKECDCNNNI